MQDLPWPVIEPVTPAVEAQGASTRLPRKILHYFNNKLQQNKTKQNKDILHPHPWFTGTSCVPHPETKLAFLGFHPEEIQMHLLLNLIHKSPEVSEVLISCTHPYQLQSSVIWGRTSTFVSKPTLSERLGISQQVSTKLHQVHSIHLSLHAVSTGLCLLQTAQEFNRCYILASRSVQTGATQSKDPRRGKLNSILSSAHSGSRLHTVMFKWNGSPLLRQKKKFFFQTSQRFKWLPETIPVTAGYFQLIAGKGKRFQNPQLARVARESPYLHHDYHRV